MNQSEISHLHCSYNFVSTSYSFIWWIHVKLLLCAKTVRCWEKNGGQHWPKNEPDWWKRCLWPSGMHSAVRASGLDSICSGRPGWLPWASGARAELCRMSRSLQSTGRLQEHSSVSMSTLRPCCYSLYLLCSDFLRATPIAWSLQLYKYITYFHISFAKFLFFFFVF